MRIIYHHRTLGDGAEGIHVREMRYWLPQAGPAIPVARKARQGVSPLGAFGLARESRW